MSATSIDNFTKDFQSRLISTEDALKLLQNNNNVVTAMATSEPRGFFENLHLRAKNLHGLTIYCANPNDDYPCFTDASLKDHLEIGVMFLTDPVRKYQGRGMVYYIPQHLSRWVKNLLRGRPIDIFWGSCSLPDRRGFVSLGLSNCYEFEILQAAKTVILEVNPKIPVTFGSTHVPIRDVTHFIECSHDLLTIAPASMEKEDLRIGEFVGDLIENQSTIQLGIGAIPNAVGLALEHKKDLGVHTEMINDAMMNLYNKGVITGRYKTIWPRKMIGSFALGSQELYDFICDNPMVELHPSSVVNDPYRMGRNHKMVSINTAVEIDITGQVCSESVGHRELSGVGGATDTHIGAQLSPGGRGIIAVRSTTKDLKHSKIVFELQPGAKVSISRNDIDTVVTEFGVAQLVGRSVAERAKALINIAHPLFRDELLFKAKKEGYI